MATELTTGWTWTRDGLNCTPLTAKVHPHETIEVVVVDETISRTKAGNLHHASVLVATPEEVFDRLEGQKRRELERAKATVERIEAELSQIADNREAFRLSTFG